MTTLENEKAQLSAEIKQLKQYVAMQDSTIEAWRKGQDEMRDTLEHAREDARMARRETAALKTRYDTAIQTFEAQGVIKRKSIRDILAEMR